MSLRIFVSLFIAVCGVSVTAAGAPDTPFLQEFHEAYPLPSEAANDVRAVTVDAKGVAWAATSSGVYRKPAGGVWKSAGESNVSGPAFDVNVDIAGVLWIGQWDGLYRADSENHVTKISDIASPISVIAPMPNGGVLACGPAGAWRVTADGTKAESEPNIPRGASAAVATESDIWIATNLALHHGTAKDSAQITILDTMHLKGHRESPAMRVLALDPKRQIWTGGMGGLVVLRNGERKRTYEPGDGLANSDVRAITFSPNGQLWVGTAMGIARYADGEWSLRHSRRWLLDDDVRDIAFAPDGGAWIATGSGVSVIRSKEMTLEQKAVHYLEACYARHIRAPGLVEKCSLETPGDLSTFKPRDDDNDGQYTCMYLAMESYRYAATKNPEARERARNAFHALMFLQTVTQTDGFVARTVIPSDWKTMADPNEEISDAEWAKRLVDEPRAKRVEKRWHPSADGKWRWKGDTSSDEITGHFYGYLMYYDLAADDEEKRVVAEHTARVMDYIMDGGYVLRDVDGEHTRWGVWAPERLNHDPLWSPERGINSVEILSYLKTTWHMTRDEKYKKEYFRLARDEHYAENTRVAKTINPAVRTHIDDELLALAWPGLFIPMDDEDLIKIYREGFGVWRNANEMEASPYFNFTYAAFAGKPDPTLDDSLFFLRDAPLDLVRWTVDNSQREDIQLSRLPEYEHIQTRKLPPPSERGVMRWDDNPWRAVQGDGGTSESDGVYWLLPYWMGRYYGYIEPAAPASAPNAPPTTNPN